MEGRDGPESLDWVVRIYGKERGFTGGQGMVIASLLRKILYDLGYTRAASACFLRFDISASSMDLQKQYH